MDEFKLVASVVSALLWSAWLAALLCANGVHPLRALLGGFSSLGWLRRVAVLFLVVQLTLFAGAKHGTNDVANVGETNVVALVEIGTNDVVDADNGEAVSSSLQGNALLGLSPCGRPSRSLASGVGAPRCATPSKLAPLMSIPSALPSVGGHSLGGYASPLPVTDIVRGYRLESVSINDDISYAMPDGASVRGTWHLTGAYEDVQKVRLGDFRFPLGTNLCSSLWTYTWGKVRPQLKNTVNEIAAVGAPMSAIPDTSWFWTAATSNDTYMLTWENFAVGRQSLTTNNQQLTTLSAQIELFRNGDFITRSNNVESVYRRVIEPNPDPLHPYGPVQDLSVINETNAYCWVDIVVNNADAWVRFEGDGPSNLADPAFAAKAGETNHVVILIGKTYKVTCDVPFAVVDKSSPAIDERWEDDRTVWLNWPVVITALEDGVGPRLLSAGLRLMGAGPTRKGFTMCVEPSFLGGTFVWTESNCPLGGSGLSFSYSCTSNSLCSGCAARGRYDYEGYGIDCTGGWCGCNYVPEEPEVHESEPDDGPYAGGVSVSFSEAAVIFEDGYANRPGEFVPRQSTRTTLSCVAHGGPNGGTATFSISGDDKLVRVMGRSLPVTVTVPPEQRVAFEIVYEGKEPSGNENDIKVHGEFQEDNAEEGSGLLVSDAELTCVQVELEAFRIAPSNNCQQRHAYGVGEEVRRRHSPASVPASWKVRVNGNDARRSPTYGAEGFMCDLKAGSGMVSLTACGVSYSTPIAVIEPQIEVRNVRANDTFSDEAKRNNPNLVDVNPVVGEAGHLLMFLDLYAAPYHVSFQGLSFVEIPDESHDCPHDRQGYYADEARGGPLSHTAQAGAGVWHEANSKGYFGTDVAGTAGAYPQPWIGGWKSWPIPMGWGFGPYDYEQFERNPTFQTFSLDADGTFRIEKFEHWAERNTLGLVWVDGSLQFCPWPW